jgi:hypothetical protein
MPKYIEDFDPNDYTQGFELSRVIAEDAPTKNSKYPRPPRPIYTQWGGLNPMTWHTYQVVTNPTKLVLVEYATHTVKLEGKQAYLFLQIVGDDRMDLFK